jgi:hypothetical protein
MDLANMRQNGVRSLDIMCHGCRHEVILNVDQYPGDLLVREFGPRMVCTRCGIVGADARPNWKEQPARESLTGSGRAAAMVSVPKMKLASADGDAAR